MLRRTLLAVSALAPAAILAGCATTGSVTTISAQVVSDVNLIANALESELPALQTVIGTNLSAGNTVLEQIKAIVAAAAGFADTISQANAQGIVTQIATDYGALMQTLAPVMGLLPPPIPQVLTAAGILLPVIEIALGMVTTAGAKAPDPATVAQARVVLAAAVQQ